ncbi:MAG: PQQ-binding-like beta-propeller repeat protein [Altererythrobacter sp.]|nr:PQQ-binding-like beta-propeller repeat protein [Altererythrobacter sp.]
MLRLKALLKLAVVGLLLAMAGLFLLKLIAPDIWEGVNRVAHRQWIAIADRYYDSRVEPDEFAVESASERAGLPEYKYLRAIAAAERTPQIRPPAMLDGTWPRSTGDMAAARFSLAGQIRPDNVERLAPVWTYEDPVARNIQATPVFDGQRLYLAMPSGTIAALSPDDGRRLWEFRPPVHPAKRGLLVHRKNDGRSTVFFTAGMALHALDAATGKPDKDFAGGSVRLDGESKVAPAICNGQIITANTGERPSVQGFDLKTGKENWSLDLAPDDLPRGTGGRPSRQSGGNPWGGFSVDTHRCMAFVSTGNPAPVLVGVERPGDNPGTSSVVAIDLKTGTIAWRFQEIMHDLWDLDIPAPPLLTSIPIDGRAVDVVATPTKAGNTLLLDRMTGQPIFDWRLRRAPTSTVPGERTASYQPDPVLPEPFARQAFAPEDVTDIGERNRQSVTARLSNALSGFYVPPSGNRPLVFYGLHGGAEWPGASTDPRTGAFFVAANNVPSILRLVPVRKVTLDNSHPGREVYLQNCAACHGNDLDGDVGPSIADAGYAMSPDTIRSIIGNGQQAMPAIPLDKAGQDQLVGYLTSGSASKSAWPRYRRADYARLYDIEGYPGSRPPWGTLTRIDLNTGRIAWQVPLGIDTALEKRGIHGTGTENFGGLLTTGSGIVFASGTKDSMIHAFSVSDGKLLWSHKLPHIGSAPPMTYVFKGEQYILVPATGGGTLKAYDDRVSVGGSFVAFKLPRVGAGG